MLMTELDDMHGLFHCFPMFALSEIFKLGPCHAPCFLFFLQCRTFLEHY